MAVSTLGISPIEFWQSTPEEIYNALDSYEKIKQNEFKEHFETVRLASFYIVNSQRTEEEQIKWNDFMNLDKKDEELKTPDWNKIDNESKGI